MRTEHWNHNFPLDPEDKFGFIYQITNKVTGKSYIGKKQYHFRRKVQVPGKKRKKTVVFDSDWRTYTGSCKPLNKDIKAMGLENFECTILFECATLGHLTYSEANLQHKMNVLTEKLPDGTPAFYNGAIMGIKFIPAGDLSTVLELERKIKEAQHLQHNFVSDAVRQSMSSEKKYHVYHEDWYPNGALLTQWELKEAHPELDGRRLSDLLNELEIQGATRYVRKSYLGLMLFKTHQSGYKARRRK